MTQNPEPKHYSLTSIQARTHPTPTRVRDPYPTGLVHQRGGAETGVVGPMLCSLGAVDMRTAL